MIGRIASALGLPSSAVLGWVLLAVVLAFGVGGVVGGVAVHGYDATACDLRLAEQKAVYDRAIQDQTDDALEQERRDRATQERLEEASAEISKVREAAQVEGARLSGELAAARQRLRLLSAAPGGGKLPAAADVAGGCDDLRTALDRAARALELLESAGDQAVGDGQHGVDVATIAAQAARARAGEAR